MRDPYDYWDYNPDTWVSNDPGAPPDPTPTPFQIPPEIYDGGPETPYDPGPQWVDPPVTPPPTYQPEPQQPEPQAPAQSGGGGFAWPKFNAPTYSPGPAFQAPAKPFEYTPFEYQAFTAPKPNQIFEDPSYKMRRDEGLNAIEHSAAAKGLTRLPQTVKALGGWNQDFASREYGNIFDREAQSYDRNRGNAFGNWQANRNNAADAYSMNYGISRDVWDRGQQQDLNAFDRNYASAKDSFQFNDWQPAALTFEDMYRRWKAGLDSQTQIASSGAGY